ncbi:hypothetical protein [Streptomyces sp. A012304]|uniref:hypothetical protein n=1 Tax=Streptomyces sp. A012304 TaxID=375446 RepID=UPI00222FF9D4|nr:hypothetical protein [Streptomyces sp. A012304]
MGQFECLAVRFGFLDQRQGRERAVSEQEQFGRHEQGVVVAQAVPGPLPRAREQSELQPLQSAGQGGVATDSDLAAQDVRADGELLQVAVLMSFRAAFTASLSLMWCSARRRIPTRVLALSLSSSKSSSPWARMAG